METIVTVNDEPTLNGITRIGARAFGDNLLKIETLSKILVGSKLFQLSWNDVNNRSICISSDKDCAVIVAIYKQKNRRENLIDVLQLAGWKVENELEIIVRHGRHTEQTKSILSKSLKAGKELSFKVPENHTAITIIAVEGKIVLFSISILCLFD